MEGGGDPLGAMAVGEMPSGLCLPMGPFAPQLCQRLSHPLDLGQDAGLGIVPVS